MAPGATMLRSLLSSSMWTTRPHTAFHSPRFLFPTRTICSATTPRTVFGTRPQVPFFTSSSINARSLLQAFRQKSGTSSLQRWLSTTSRSSLRYHPPSRRPQSQSILDQIPQDVIFYGIIGINVAVFGMWFMANQQYKQERDESGLVWMYKNFTDSWTNFSAGRIWTPLTAVFSHSSFSHILFNMFTFFFMARPVLSSLGTRQFLFLYLGGGLISSFSSMIWAIQSGKNNYASQGASGAVFAVATVLACAAPNMKFYLYGLLPVPAWLAISGLFGYDLYSTITDTGGNTDTAGHVAGIVAGILYFLGRRFGIII